MTRHVAYPDRALAALMALAVVAAGLVATVPVRAAATSTAVSAATAPQAFVPDYSAAPYNGTPISHGLGPTYGETWCATAAPGSSIANQQGAPLALIPYEAFGCLLEQFKTEATAAGVPSRLSFGVNTLTDAGRTQYWAVVNAMETPEQIEGYNNWVTYRGMALTNPTGAQAFLDAHDNVKLPVFMENNIHGDEEEGADSMMQIIRDLSTMPRGTSATVDNFLDHAILVTIPSMNPDGRFNGTRANQNGFDMNRDWLVQSQPEVRANLRLQVEWLAPVMFATHGYVNPTLVDGLTKPHNPGLEYDVFAYWNQRRLDENQKALARIGQGITRPVNGPIVETVPDKQTPITNAASSGTTATLTTNGPHGQVAGNVITVSGVTQAGYNGSFTVLSTPTTTSLTYTTSGSDLGASSAGIVAGAFTTTSRGNCSDGNTPGPASNICGNLLISGGIGLTESGTTVTVTTTTASTTFPPHVGDTVLITGAAVPGYNGGPFRVTSVPTPTTFTYESPNSGLAPSGSSIFSIAASPGGLSKSGNIVTVNTTAPNTAAVGDVVVITGAVVATYNGTFTVAAVNSPTQFTYTAANANAAAASGGGTATVGVVQVQTGPGQAEGWDDLGPFYTQTYGAFWGVDGSTMEMCSNCSAPFTGRLGSKTAQYVGFWSSADFWVANRGQLFDDQMKIFVRGVNEAPRPNCCDDPLVASRGFTEAEHNWMTEYPKAYIIPKGDAHQRSDAEANRMAKWVLDNGILLREATADFTWDGQTYAAGSYVVMMNQPLRGLAFTALGPGLDYSARINQLYAPPGGWSHGLMWGADTVEVPNGAAFAPPTTLITSVSALHGGVADGTADWYAVKLGGVRDEQTILDLLRDGVYGEIAENSFVAGGGPMPAGSIIFPSDPNTRAALAAAGEAGGLTFQAGTGAKPATTRLSEAPKVGILVNSANPTINDQVYSLRRIFGSDAVFVSVVTGTGSLQNAADDPLLGIDVLYNTGQAYPAAANTQARSRLNAFFARGGGYIGSSSSANNLTFLTGAVPPLVGGTFTAASLGSFGGTAVWSNAGGSASPLTGAFPSRDYLYLPQNVTYFNATPTGASVDGRYLTEMGSVAKPRGPTEGYVAGLWLNRSSAAAIAANDAPVIIHGNTTATNPQNGNAASRYTGIATSPFSRSDFERIWGWIVQSSLWGDLTDEALLDQIISADTLGNKTFGNPDFEFGATSSSGRSVAVTASGQCTVSSAWTPTTIHITGAGSCTITASQPGDGNFNPATNVEQTFDIVPAAASATYTGDSLVFTSTDKNAPTSATVLLQATVIDTALKAASPDTANGDIRTATVSFSEAGNPVCGGLAVGLIGTPLHTGSAQCSVVLQAGAHVIDISVGGNYTGTGQGQITVIVAKAGDTDLKAGDGKFTLGTPAGTYAGDQGSEAKVHVDGKVDAKGPSGSFQLDYTAGATKYRIDMTALVVLGRARQAGGTQCDKPPSATCSESIYLRGAANLVDRTTGKPVAVTSGYVQVAVTDRGKSTPDSIAVTLWQGSTLLFSSDWNGAQSLERALTGGNLGQ